MLKALISVLLIQLNALPAIAQTKTIKVGYSPVISTAGIFIAQEKGYFKKAGLTVELLPFDSSGAAMTPLLGSGELDVGAGNISTGLINAVAQGLQIRIVADKGHTPDANGYMSLLVRSDYVASGRYKSPKDLKGLRIGLTSLGGVSQQILFEKFLTKAGLQPSDVTYLKLSYPEMNVAIEKKELDAAIQLEPYTAMAEAKGFAKRVADASEVYPHQQSGALFFSGSFVKRETEAIAFLSAYLRGVQDYVQAETERKTAPAKLKEINSLLNKYVRLDPVETWDRVRPVGLNVRGTLNLESLENDLRWYESKGYVKKAPDIKVLTETTLAEKAAVQLEKNTP